MSTFINSFYFYGGAANTFIGGVSGVINTPALLAAKLQNYPSGTAFDVSKIFGFTIVGSDIECYIGVDYQLGATNVSMTSYIDNGNYCKEIIGSFRHFINLVNFKTEGVIKLSGLYIFRNCPSLNILLSFPNCIICTNQTFYCDGNEPFNLYLPICTQYGASVGYNKCIYLIRSGMKIYAHPSMATINGGAEEGDIAYGRNTRGATIIYV